MLEYKTKAEMSHIPQSQDAHQMTMEDSENNFQNIAEEIPMVILHTNTNTFLATKTNFTLIPDFKMCYFNVRKCLKK